MMLNNNEIFFIGCVGAMAPEIIRLYKLRNSLRFSLSWGYILISIVFVLLGGFITDILEPSSNYAAFYSGVGTPFIINAITKETEEAATPSKIPVVKNINSDPQITVPNTNTEITRDGEKGITEEEALQGEKEALERISLHNKKMSLKEFLRAL